MQEKQYDEFPMIQTETTSIIVYYCDECNYEIDFDSEYCLDHPSASISSIVVTTYN